MTLGAGGRWVIDARKWFKGPVTNVSIGDDDSQQEKNYGEQDEEIRAVVHIPPPDNVKEKLWTFLL